MTTVLGGFLNVIHTLAIFLCDYRGLQTSPVYGFSQIADIAGTEWLLMLGEAIGRELSRIRFSRQGKYL